MKRNETSLLVPLIVRRATETQVSQAQRMPSGAQPTIQQLLTADGCVNALAKLKAYSTAGRDLRAEKFRTRTVKARL